MASKFRIAPGKITVIPHGDYKFFVPDASLSCREAKIALGIEADYITLLFFGAIRPNKGLHNILRAMPEIIKIVPKLKLLIAGELCQDFSPYEDLIKKHHLQEHVWTKIEYIPNQDVYKYFSAADIVVLPYDEVTGSGILQIAYAFAKPVLTSDLPGFRETVEDGKNGFVVNITDVNKVVERLVILCTDGLKRKEMGQHSLYLAETKYNWSQIAGQTMAVYQ